MVSFGQRFRVVEKSRFTTFLLLLAASILNRWEPEGECCMEMKNLAIKQVTIDDYDQLFELWNSTEQSRRALNPVDDSREGIERYLKRNPNTCFAAVRDGRIIGVILTGHDGRRGIIHHMCIHPEFRRMGIASHLVSLAEDALKKEGIQKVFGLVFVDNEAGNQFWEKQGYSLRTNLNYRNKSLNEKIPTGK